MAFSPKRKVICDMVLFICGHGGTGRLEGFRFLCQPACGFESHYPHHVVADCISFATTFLQKSSLTHSVAPPLQTEPAALGFGLVLAANLKAAASIVLRCYKTILYKPLFLRSWLCGNSLYETEIGRIPKIERLSRMAEPFGFFISCFRR